MELKGKKVLVVGIGLSGEASAEKLIELGAEVTVCDHNQDEEIRRKSQLLAKRGAEFKLGVNAPNSADGFDLIIVSPGVPEQIELIDDAHRRKIPVWSEIELAFRLTKAKIVGITGTNGKTTTTKIVGDIFKRAGIPAVIGGNIGFPLIRAVEKASTKHWLISELSSFQLSNIIKFRAHIALMLNITEDHLDRHSDFQNYADAKAKIFENQKRSDYAILNLDDPVVAEFETRVRAQVIPFSKKPKERPGVYLDGKRILARWDKEMVICDVGELKIKGEHNIENSLAAVAVCVAANIAQGSIRDALRTFEPLEHRCEYVGTIDGVDYYNDSKATNPDATIKAITAFSQPITLLAGGRNKGNSFKKLGEALGKKIKAAILFGESAGEIAGALDGKVQTIRRTSSLPEAVIEAHRLSLPGEVVLLSPACASFDMFKNYEERGWVFKEAVRRLKEV